MSGINFHPEVRALAEADARGEPPPHLILSVRKHDVRGYSVRGEREKNIGPHHETANAAVRAIRAFCRARTHTARVNVYDADGTLYTIVEIGLPAS